MSKGGLRPGTDSSGAGDERLAGAGLKPKDIEVLAMHFYDGQSYAQIGRFFGVTKQSIKDRIHKALRYLARAGLPRPQRVTQPGDVRPYQPDRHVTPMDPHVLDTCLTSEGFLVFADDIYHRINPSNRDPAADPSATAHGRVQGRIVRIAG